MPDRVLPLLSLLALVACTAGTATLPPGSGAPSGSSTSPTEPEPSALGASCTEYLACCTELAERKPQLAASCDSLTTQIETAQKNGVSTTSYESACKSGVDALKKAGYCKAQAPPQPPPPKEMKCVPSCTEDADCANSCPAISGGVHCCDTTTRTCFVTNTSMCPKPDDGGGDPPPSY